MSGKQKKTPAQCMRELRERRAAVKWEAVLRGVVTPPAAQALAAVLAKDWSAPRSRHWRRGGGRVPRMSTARLVYEGTIALHTEDSGAALISDHIESTVDPRTYVTIVSWDETPAHLHPELRALLGKRVRVTVEVVPTT